MNRAFFWRDFSRQSEFMMIARAKRALCLTQKRSRGVDGFSRRVAFCNNKIDVYQRLRATPP
jgi:hypothetical protein